MVKAQMKIQQMAFMIIAVFIFFVMVGLFFLNYHVRTISYSYNEIQEQKAVSSLSAIANMPELNCEDSKENCIDLDKLKVISQFSQNYTSLWPVYSISVYRVAAEGDEIIFGNEVRCPATGCNVYHILESEETTSTYSKFVNICSKQRRQDNRIYDQCEIGKLVVGIKEI
jgi:hypothetical protein